MTEDHPLVQLVAQLTDQASNAIWRILNNRYMRHPGTLGTLEIFRAIELSRTGMGKEMFKSLASKGWDIRDSRVDSAEYGKVIDRVRGKTTLTKKAERVLKKAIAYADTQGEHFAGTSHLLLALIDVPDTSFASMAEVFSFNVDAVREKLRAHLGLDNEIKPAMRAYDLCARIERDMKNAIMRRMKRKCDRWWAKGVPVQVRKRCAEMREEEGCVLDVDSYLYLIDIREIISSNWILFKDALHQKDKSSQGKDKATSWLVSVNDVRKVVMHPGKREITPDDIDTLKDAYNKVQAFCARLDEE